MTTRYTTEDPEPSIDCGGCLDTLQRQLRLRSHSLKNPRWGDARRFPVFRAGMSTAQYIASYEMLNKARGLAPVEFTHRQGMPAPVETRSEE